MGLPWTCPRGYARPRYRWRYPGGYQWWGGAGGSSGNPDNEWEERHMLDEIYRMCHRLSRHEMEEGPKIDEIYYLVHEIARGVAALQAEPVGIMPPIEQIPMQPIMSPITAPCPTPMPSPLLTPAPSYPCPSWPQPGLG